MTRTMAVGRYRDALGVAEFRALAGSSLVSVLGDSLAYLAVTVLVSAHGLAAAGGVDLRGGVRAVPVRRDAAVRAGGLDRAAPDADRLRPGLRCPDRDDRAARRPAEGVGGAGMFGPPSCQTQPRVPVVPVV
jgi:hypothetical protein